MFYIVEESVFGVPLYAKGVEAKNKAAIREKIWDRTDYDRLKVLTLNEMVSKYNRREIIYALDNVKEHCFIK